MLVYYPSRVVPVKTSDYFRKNDLIIEAEFSYSEPSPSYNRYKYKTVCNVFGLSNGFKIPGYPDYSQFVQ